MEMRACNQRWRNIGPRGSYAAIIRGSRPSDGVQNCEIWDVLNLVNAFTRSG
jgi:hypothetical protein